MECQGTSDLRSSIFKELGQDKECYCWRQIETSKTLETMLGGNPFGLQNHAANMVRVNELG